MEKLGDILARNPDVQREVRRYVDMTPTPSETARMLAYLVNSVETGGNIKPKETLKTVREELVRLGTRIEYLDAIAKSDTVMCGKDAWRDDIGNAEVGPEPYVGGPCCRKPGHDGPCSSDWPATS